MKKFLILFFLALIVVFGAFFYWKYYYSYSAGYRAGLLQKFSYRGAIFKTYEGEIILSSIESSKDVALASEKFYFSVTDQQTANQLISCIGKLVTIHYQEKNGVLFWRGDTKYIVDSVKLAR